MARFLASRAAPIGRIRYPEQLNRPTKQKALARRASNFYFQVKMAERKGFEPL
jgi:hypothetical protein